MAKEDRPRKPAKRTRALIYRSSPVWDLSRLEGLLCNQDGNDSEIGEMTGLLRDDDDDGGVGDREPRKPLPPLDSDTIGMPLPADQ
jgi:hypothetical protein